MIFPPQKVSVGSYLENFVKIGPELPELFNTQYSRLGPSAASKQRIW
jgi:hypothetical protein